MMPTFNNFPQTRCRLLPVKIPQSSLKSWTIRGVLAMGWPVALFVILGKNGSTDSRLSPDETSPLAHLPSLPPIPFLHRPSWLHNHIPRPSQRWERSGMAFSLLDTGIVALTPDKQSRLPDASVPFSSEPPTYLGAVEVFHQLHCLDMVRRESVRKSGDVDGRACTEQAGAERRACEPLLGLPSAELDVSAEHRRYCHSLKSDKTRRFQASVRRDTPVC